VVNTFKNNIVEMNFNKIVEKWGKMIEEIVYFLLQKLERMMKISHTTLMWLIKNLFVLGNCGNNGRSEQNNEL
jgi:hypothetical protein